MNNYNNQDYYWWKKEDKKVHESVFQYTEHLESRQSSKSHDNLRNMKLYGNFDMLGLQAYQYARSESSYNTNNRLTLNVIKNMIDTAVSKITKNKPKPLFLTDGGDWSLQSKAKKLTKFIEGQYSYSKFYEKAAMAFLDAAIFGTGAIKIYHQDGEIRCERVFIDEILVDDSEAYYAEPRQMHQRKYIHRDVLKAMFPDQSGYIDDVGSHNSRFHENATQNEMVKVIESWHLPSGPKAKDGKHSICIDNKTLWCEEYTKSYFPFVFLRYDLRPIGFWGQGLSEQLSGLQLEINKILKTIQVSMHLTSIPKVFVEANSKVVTAHLNNKIGGIIKYVGTKPSYESVGAIPAELFNHLDRLYERAYEIVGISQFAAHSEKPAGLDSGKALREYADIETERFQSVSTRYQQMFIDASRIYIDMARDLYEKQDKNLKVLVKGRKFLETIEWKEVDIEEDKYLLDIFPISALSQHPSGRLQDIQELMQAGIIPPEEGRRLLNFPDLEAFETRESADMEDIDRIIEFMIEKGDYQTPEPYQNLEYGIVRMQKAYLMYKIQNAPEERLELFRRWIEDANDLIARANTPALEEVNQAEAPLPALDPTQAGEVPLDPQASMDELLGGAPVDPETGLPQEAGVDPNMAVDPNMPIDPNTGLPMQEEPMAVPQAAPQSDILPV